MQLNSDLRNLISVVAQSVGAELLGREPSSDEIARIVYSIAQTGRVKGNGVPRTKLTPPQVAKMFGVNPDKVLNWIRAGELRAVNVAANSNGRPRYRISLEDLKAFENRRTAVANSPSPRRRQRKNENVIEFF